MSAAGFKLAIPAIKQLQTYALDRMATFNLLNVHIYKHVTPQINKTCLT
jgi:hypothetical protein